MFHFLHLHLFSVNFCVRERPTPVPVNSGSTLFPGVSYPVTGRRTGPGVRKSFGPFVLVVPVGHPTSQSLR